MTRTEHAARPARESVSKRIGRKATAGIKARDGHKCAYCPARAATESKHMHLDHLTPRHEGGKDEVTNLVLACHRCNSARKNMSLAQWSAYAAVKYGLTFTASAIRAQARRKLPEVD